MRSRRLRLHIGASKVHKWLALIVGAQLLIWFASGAFMSFVPIEVIHGDHLVSRRVAEAIPPGTQLANPAGLIKEPFESITWRMLRGTPVAEVKAKGEVRLYDAATLRPLAPLSADEAKAIASAAWIADVKPAATVDRVTAESTEYRGALPAWRVNFSDPDSTRVYVAENTGIVTAVRTGTWRVYDFLWGLHIMDWKNHEDFNSPWLLAFALGGLALGIAGTVLLIMRWPIRRRR